MAIEDEIINISDIDVGTEILKSDKLLIETSNGTKMLAFKDFVVGPDNISSIRQDQIEKNNAAAAGGGAEATAHYSTVSGFEILTNATTFGLNTEYNQISGTIELGKFNYNAIANLASVSADILQNTSAVNELRTVLDNLAAVLESTTSTALNSITLSTSACNAIVTGAHGGGTSKSSRNVRFTKKELDPATTNPNCAVALSPFKITFPNAEQGFVDGTKFMIIGQFTQASTNTGVNSRQPGKITIYKDTSTGSTEIYSNQAAPLNRQFSSPNNFTAVTKINFGDSLRLVADTPINKGSLDIFKIS
jgi:hypothetical protein